MKINKEFFPYIVLVAFIVFFIVGMATGFAPSH
jgi:hypothetical protein